MVGNLVLKYIQNECNKQKYKDKATTVFGKIYDNKIYCKCHQWWLVVSILLLVHKQKSVNRPRYSTRGPHALRRRWEERLRHSQPSAALLPQHPVGSVTLVGVIELSLRFGFVLQYTQLDQERALRNSQAWEIVYNVSNCLKSQS